MNQDILLEEEDDLLISADGDFVVGHSDEQHIRHIGLAVPGDYRFAPRLGAALRYVVNGQLTQEHIANYQKQLQGDGYKGAKVAATTDGLEVKTT